jgi:hypothetical protein
MSREISRDFGALLARPIEELKDLARGLMKHHSGIPERLTLAFRNGNELSDDDWKSVIQDLAELGFLKDEDVDR